MSHRPFARLLTLAAVLTFPLAALAQDALTLVRVSAGEVTEQMRKNGVPVCFEERAEAEFLSAKDALAQLEAIPEAQRTAGEKARLFTLATMLKATPGNSARIPKLRRFDFAYQPPGKDPSKLLDALVAADPDYAWKQLGPRYIVYPRKGSPLDRPTPAFTASKLTYPALLGTLNKDFFAPAQYQWIGIFLPVSQTYKTKTYSFQIPATTGWTFLQTLADQLGPNLVWITQNTGEQRTLYFTGVKSRGASSWN